MPESKAKRTAAARAPAAKGQSLVVGLNALNQRHYGGFGGSLRSAEHDATALATLAQAQGLAPTMLLGAQATRAKLLGAVRKAAKSLRAGDMFMVSFAGLGGQVPDVTGDEASRTDKTWCLFDAQLIDKELLLELSRFGQGVNLLLVEDTCHSGTVTRGVPMMIDDNSAGASQPRLLPAAVAMRTYRDNRSFYDRLQADLVRAINAQSASDSTHTPGHSDQFTESALKGRLAREFAPTLVALSAAQDNQTAEETSFGGLFTQTLLAALQRAGPPASVTQLAALVRARMPPSQTPNLWSMGPAAAWLKQPLFKA